MMKNEFVPYDIALALKELGFDERCFSYYQFQELSICPRENGDDIKYPGDNKFDRHQNSYLEENDDCSAPLYQQAFRWFREKHKLVSEIQAPDGKEGKWNPTIHKVYGFGNYYDNEGFNTYEKAELACLRKLIEIVKPKQR